MEFTRNHYLAIGLLLLLLGVQLRLVESYTLNEKTSKFLVERMQSNSSGQPFLASFAPTTRRVIHPPDWLGWVLLSTGAVLVLQSLAMKKPGG